MFIGKLEDKNSALNKYAEECTKYASLYMQYKQLIRSNSILKVYENYFDSIELFKKDAKLYGVYQSKINTDIVLCLEIKAHTKRLDDINSIIASFKTNGDVALGEIEVNIKKLNATYEATMLEYRKNNDAIDLLSKKYKALCSIEEIRNQMIMFNKQRKSERKKAHLANTQERFNQMLKDLQFILGKKTYELNMLLQQKSVVNNIEKRIKDLEEELTAHQIAIDELSPTDGIIAEILGGFINEMLDKINGFIESFWSYSLKLLPFKLEVSEGININYKFPFKAEDVPEGKDISFGSESIKAVINEAFIIVAILYLNLQFRPLNLDEFTGSFDAHHKVAATRAIEKLVESNAFSQFFVISHDYQGYGALSNAEILILHPDNIIMPNQEYNQHLEIYV